MTNELGTTLQDIAKKVERKREALRSIERLLSYANGLGDGEANTIRKYIEEN